MNLWDLITDPGESLAEIFKIAASIGIQGVTEAIKAVGTWWLHMPSPQLQGTTSASPAQRVQQYTKWAVMITGMVSMAVALVVVAKRRDQDSTLDVVFGFFRVILVTGAAIPGVQLWLQFSDEASPWLLQQISGGTLEDGLGTLTGGTGAAAASMGIGVYVLLIVITIVSILGGLINMAFVMFSYGLLPAIVGLLPIAAAYAFTEKGRRVFDKSVGWLIAVCLFKPVSAIIYGVGIAQARMITGGVEDAGTVVIQALYGCVVLAAAAITLPGLVRLVAPATAAGSRGGGGGQMLVGAALVAVGAITGGAAAVAGKAAAAGAATRGAAPVAAGATGQSGAAAAGGAGSAGSAGQSGAGSAGANGSGSAGSNGSSGATGADGAGTSGANGADGQTSGQGSGAQASGAQPNAAGGTDSNKPASGANMRSMGGHQLAYQLGNVDGAIDQGDV